jgi:hypothetical protein
MSSSVVVSQKTATRSWRLLGAAAVTRHRSLRASRASSLVRGLRSHKSNGPRWFGFVISVVGQFDCGGPILFLINVAPPLQKALRQIDDYGETRQ